MPHDIWEGEVIDLGERTLEVVTIPGHTPGSIALLDVERRVLISGDTIQDGTIFMFGIQRELHAYWHSLEKLQGMAGRFDTVYPSHGSFPVAPSQVSALHDAVGKILDGDMEAEPTEFHTIKVKRYDVGVASFLVDADL